MKRMHIHLSVADLDEGVRFYSGMFAAQPTVVKEDYAKWMLDDPSVNFAISKRGADIGLNHLGIQVESEEELDAMQTRLSTLQPNLQKEENGACCYAKSDKYWVHGPTGVAWETFQTLDTIPVFGEPDKTDAAKEACSVPLVKFSFKPKSVPLAAFHCRLLNPAVKSAAECAGHRRPGPTTHNFLHNR